MNLVDETNISTEPPRVDHPEFKRLERVSRQVNLRRRQPVYLPGDAAEAVYIIQKGRVKLSRVSEDGKEFTMAIMTEGDIFGELEVLEGTSRDMMAEAIEDSIVTVINGHEFQMTLRENSDLSLEITKLIGTRMKKIENRMEDLFFREVPARLARLLIELSCKWRDPVEGGIRLSFRITHQELANLIGSTRETVSAAMSNFKKQGLIQQDHRQITISNREGLVLAR